MNALSYVAIYPRVPKGKLMEFPVNDLNCHETSNLFFTGRDFTQPAGSKISYFYKSICQKELKLLITADNELTD